MAMGTAPRKPEAPPLSAKQEVTVTVLLAPQQSCPSSSSATCPHGRTGLCCLGSCFALL